ncbi:MAG TPA: cupredoxin domain-containing protein [Pyrinomonadaceae bacterium]|jgi:plastocyanin domain-containing protein
MNTTQIIVTLVGLGAIGWIVWYFWLWKGETVAAGVGAGGVLEVNVTVRGGYQPASIEAKAGQPLRLNFTRREASMCGEEVVLPEFGKRAHLPENRTVGIEVTPPKAGEYEFTCGMNMYKGKIVVR